MSIFSASMKSTFRDKSSIFWSLAFPIMIFFVFASIFLHGGETLYYSNHPLPDWIPKAEDEKKADVVLRIDGKTVKAIVRRGDTSEITGTLHELAAEIAGGSHIRVVVKNVGRKNVEVVFFFTSALAMVTLSSGMFETVKILKWYSEDRILDLIGFSEAGKFEILSAMILPGAVLALTSSFLVYLVSRLLGLSIPLNLPLALSILLSYAVSAAAGYAVSRIFRTAKGAMSFLSVFYHLNTFLAGIYFPIDFLPPWMRWISFLLPGRYIVLLIRNSLR